MPRRVREREEKKVEDGIQATGLDKMYSVVLSLWSLQMSMWTKKYLGEHR